MNKKSETALEYFFYGEEFELWKLHTVEDYIFCFGMLALGILVFIIIAKIMNAQRDQVRAVARTNKRLKSLGKKPFKYFENVTLHLPSGDVKLDGLMMDKSGIYLVKIYGWGLKVFGTPDGATWRREDNERKEEIPNPLLEIKRGIADIEAFLAEQGIQGVKMMPMVVFADTFKTPELYLGYGSYSTTYSEMKAWYKKQSDVTFEMYDYNKVTTLIEKELMN